MIKAILLGLLLLAAWLLVVRPLLMPRRSRPAVPRDERAARALLGVGPDAGDDAIRAAHRRLVADAHPDRGGSEELAGRLNAARDLLLRK